MSRINVIEATPLPDEESTPGEAWVVIPDPITDGSAALQHDGYDRQMWAQAQQDYGRLREAVCQAAQTLVTAPALLRDLFFSFYKRVVQPTPIVPLTPAYQVNAEILAQILTTVEWQQVRAAGTVDDPLAAAMATIGVAARTLTALDQATVARINQLHELESGAADLWSLAEALEDLAQQATGDRAVTLFQQAADARAQIQQAVAAVAALAAELAAGAEAREDVVRRAARRGLDEAEAAIDQTQRAIAAYSGGQADFTLSGRTAGRALSMKEKLHLATTVGKSRRLQEIAAICGRLQRIALKVQETRIQHAPDEVTAVTVGRDLGHLLPSETALLADPDLEPLFFLTSAEGRLLQYHLEGREKQGQGPILVALDNSGSMTEPAGGGLTKEVWSKGVTLALLAIARKQQRDLAVLHFSSAGQLAVQRFPKGRAAHSAVIACMEHFFNGGTVFEPWMQTALQLVEEAAFDRADVICVTDGLTAISPTWREEWNRRRRGRGMRAYGVLIGTNQGAGELAGVTDALLTLHNLQEDLPVLQTIFAI